ncbi:MAG TPA: hypothetical protein VHZ06_01145 [Marmoricola sp.]|jgi:hypothetical protein|nr:hypothetical protein [Marmoricola sp.]
MEADDLASADDLWWSWAVLTAGDRLPEGARASLDADEHVLTYEYGASWASMQRIGGGRAVLWGLADGSAKDAVSQHVDPLAGAPDWASSNAVYRSIRSTKPGFLAWYSRDGWDTSTTGMFDGVVDLLSPLLRADPHLVAEARGSRATGELLEAAHGVAHVAVQGAIRNRLKAQIHRQMRDTSERDRGLPERPTLLARWLRVSEPGISFEHTVLVDEGELVSLDDAPWLPEAHQTSLNNVLRELHLLEAGEESGAWMAAQVRVAAGRITVARAFDSLPSWYAGKGPTLRALAWEMQQRGPAWRPAWATLLPS